MALSGAKISALPVLPSTQATDVAPFVQGGITYKGSVSQLATFFNINLAFLPIAGGTMSGAINMGTFGITNAANPIADQDVATKKYVDSVATGLNVQPSCISATTANLTATYNNGISGVGATLTNSGTQVALVIDNVTLMANQRVLVKDQSAPAQNGIYTVTNIGSGSTNWVLTRATNYDTPAQIKPGDFVLVIDGVLNGQTQWVQTSTVTTIGTDPITWNAFGTSAAGIISSIQDNAYIYSQDTGVANVYVATLAPPLGSYTEGAMVILNIANTNTGASTLNVNSLGAQNILTPFGTALVAGDLVAGRRAWLLYTGSAFQLINRNIEARIQNQSFNYVADTGIVNVYAAILVPAVTAYVTGLTVRIKIATANTASSTLNVNGLGTKNIVLPDAASPLIANNLVVGQIATFIYDGTNFQLQNPAPGATGTGLYNLGTGAVSQHIRIGTVANTPVFTNAVHWENFISFSSTTTWVVPSGVTRIFPRGVGAGGGGGNTTGGSSSANGGGGGGGGSFEKLLTVIPGDTLTITIGSGGAGTGGTGGNTTIAGTGFSTLTARGGNGGTPSNGSSNVGGGDGGTASNGDVNLKGRPGEYGFTSLGGGNGGAGAGAIGGGGGVLGSPGEAGDIGAGGGGGSGSNQGGGAGGNGLVTIHY